MYSKEKPAKKLASIHSYITIGLISLFILGVFLSANKTTIRSIDPTQAATVVATSKQDFLTKLSSANPGDTIEIQGQIQGNIVIKKSGAANNPITVKGGTIKGGSGRIVEMRDSNWLVFDGITIDGTGGDTSFYILNSDNNVIKNSRIMNAGGECLRIKAFSNNNSVLNNTVENCGATKWAPPTGKNGEGIYIGTAPEQWSRNGTEGYSTGPDTSNNNYVAGNTIRPYPGSGSTHGNECVDIKEGAQWNLVENNTCSGQFDKNSGGMESRSDNNIFKNNTFNSTICGAGIRIGGDVGTAWGKGNMVIQNNFRDYSSSHPDCALSASTTADKTAVLGAVKMQTAGQGYMCGNNVNGKTPVISGAYASEINQTIFTGACDQSQINALLANKVFGVSGGTTVNTPNPTQIPAQTSVPKTPAPTKTPTPTAVRTNSPQSTSTPKPSSNPTNCVPKPPCSLSNLFCLFLQIPQNGWCNNGTITCLPVDTYRRNPITNQCIEFPTTCTPDGWGACSQ